MEPVSLWAAVEFTACNGSTEALLTAAARAGLHPYGVTALPGELTKFMPGSIRSY